MKFTLGAGHGHSAFLIPAAAAVNNSNNKKRYHLPHTLLHTRFWARCLTCINLFNPHNDPMKGVQVWPNLQLICKTGRDEGPEGTMQGKTLARGPQSWMFSMPMTHSWSGVWSLGPHLKWDFTPSHLCPVCQDLPPAIIVEWCAIYN